MATLEAPRGESRTSAAFAALEQSLAPQRAPKDLLYRILEPLRA